MASKYYNNNVLKGCMYIKYEDLAIYDCLLPNALATNLNGVANSHLNLYINIYMCVCVCVWSIQVLEGQKMIPVCCL